MVGPAATSMHSCRGITRAERSQLAAYFGIVCIDGFKCSSGHKLEMEKFSGHGFTQVAHKIAVKGETKAVVFKPSAQHIPCMN